MGSVKKLRKHKIQLGGSLNLWSKILATVGPEIDQPIINSPELHNMKYLQ